MHKHWCDFAGHEWECSGAARRLYRNKPTPCVCLQHGTSMDDGDHSACSIELIACPEHHDDQMRAMGYDPAKGWPEQPEGSEESSMFRDAEGKPTIGFCLWCGRDFYTMEEHETHFSVDGPLCPVYEELKAENCMPPGLAALLEAADLDEPEEGE